MDRHLNDLYIYEILKNQTMSEAFIEKHFINTDNTLFNFKDKLDFWDSIAINQELSESFIDKYKDKWNWDIINENQKLSNKFKMQYSEYLYARFLKS